MLFVDFLAFLVRMSTVFFPVCTVLGGSLNRLGFISMITEKKQMPSPLDAGLLCSVRGS